MICIQVTASDINCPIKFKRKLRWRNDENSLGRRILPKLGGVISVGISGVRGGSILAMSNWFHPVSRLLLAAAAAHLMGAVRSMGQQRHALATPWLQRQ